jgi:hypothetical protein
MSGGPGGTSQTSGSPTGAGTPGAGQSTSPGSDESDETEPSNGVDGVEVTMLGETYAFAAQQKAFRAATMVYLEARETDSAESRSITIRINGGAKGAYACAANDSWVSITGVEGRNYSATSCVINIRKVGAIGETIEGDLTGTLERLYETGDNGKDDTTTAPETISIRASFGMTVQRPE